jgi:hypothetical protein
MIAACVSSERFWLRSEKRVEDNMYRQGDGRCAPTLDNASISGQIHFFLHVTTHFTKGRERGLHHGICFSVLDGIATALRRVPSATALIGHLKLQIAMTAM